jgi:hypothetical protein
VPDVWFPDPAPPPARANALYVPAGILVVVVVVNRYQVAGTVVETALLAEDASDVPTAFVAVTVNV